MDQQKAFEIAKNFIADEANVSIIVSSDGGVYLNNSIEVMQKHCDDNKLQMFVIKTEEDTSDLPEEEDLTPTKKPKKQKDA